ncbi:hypothetical protein CEXT_133821 [Caerostris extrusa]|uniref:Uncharacterized protein n=1 Tax=Caerostris extrusa TaxID=172846 RepID=A0AAV4V688_CAEEX|nr:hypothetical protein CEXT_133821 [Caerostris extrusa]
MPFQEFMLRHRLQTAGRIRSLSLEKRGLSIPCLSSERISTRSQNNVMTVMGSFVLKDSSLHRIRFILKRISPRRWNPCYY